MALDSSTSGDAFAQEIADQVARSEPLSNAAMASRLAQVYHEHAQASTVAGADMSAGGTLSLLETAFEVVDPAAQVDKLAAGLCSYWATCGAPGVPAHGGTAVVSVTVAGASVLAAMRAALQSLITTEEVEHPFRKFFETTDAVVKTIPVVVVEMIPGTPPAPTPFPETIL